MINNDNELKVATQMGVGTDRSGSWVPATQRGVGTEVGRD